MKRRGARRLETRANNNRRKRDEGNDGGEAVTGTAKEDGTKTRASGGESAQSSRAELPCHYMYVRLDRLVALRNIGSIRRTGAGVSHLYEMIKR